MSKQNDLSFLVRSWPSPIVARKKVAEFSGGILNPRTLANLDAKKEGPKGKIVVGRTVAYRTEDLVKWMEERGAQNRKVTNGEHRESS